MKQGTLIASKSYTIFKSLLIFGMLVLSGCSSNQPAYFPNYGKQDWKNLPLSDTGFVTYQDVDHHDNDLYVYLFSIRSLAEPDSKFYVVSDRNYGAALLEIAPGLYELNVQCRRGSHSMTAPSASFKVPLFVTAGKTIYIECTYPGGDKTKANVRISDIKDTPSDIRSRERER